MADPTTVTIAGQEWRLKPLTAPISHMVDAVQAVSRDRRGRKARTLGQQYNQAVERAKLRKEPEPNPPEELMQLSGSLLREHWENALEFLELEDYPEDGGRSIEDLEAALRAHYGASHSDGMTTFEDLAEVYTIAAEAWSKQVEEASDIPPLSSADSSAGQPSGPTKRPSKPRSSPKGARSKTSTSSPTSA